MFSSLQIQGNEGRYVIANSKPIAFYTNKQVDRSIGVEEEERIRSCAKKLIFQFNSK
jgi:hypothetical protein